MSNTSEELRELYNDLGSECTSVLLHAADEMDELNDENSSLKKELEYSKAEITRLTEELDECAEQIYDSVSKSECKQHVREAAASEKSIADGHYARAEELLKQNNELQELNAKCALALSQAEKRVKDSQEQEHVAIVAPSSDGTGIIGVEWNNTQTNYKLMYGDKLFASPVITQTESELLDEIERSKEESNRLHLVASTARGKLQYEQRKFDEEIENLTRKLAEQQALVKSLPALIAKECFGSERQSGSVSLGIAYISVVRFERDHFHETGKSLSDIGREELDKLLEEAKKQEHKELQTEIELLKEQSNTVALNSAYIAKNQSNYIDELSRKIVVQQSEIKQLNTALDAMSMNITGMPFNPEEPIPDMVKKYLPEGYTIVPNEPTDEMLLALACVSEWDFVGEDDYCAEFDFAYDGYCQMLSVVHNFTKENQNGLD